MTYFLSRILPAFATILLAAGCAQNPYNKFYSDATFGYSAARLASIQPPAGPAKLIRVPQIDKALVELWAKQGYIQLGFSEFTSAGNVPESAMRAQAKKVGAQHVFYTTAYSHSEAGVRPVLNYVPGQTYTTNTSGNASVYGGGGGALYGNYQGTTTTTTPGQLHTTYVPATFHHVKYTAFFYAGSR